MDAGGTRTSERSATALIQRAGRPRILRPGQLLHVSGDACPTVDLVESGEVKLTLVVDGRPIMIASAGPGSLIGATDTGIRSTTAEAVSPTRLVAVSRSTFNELIDREPAVRLYVMGLLADELRHARRRIADQCARTTRERIAAALLERHAAVIETTQDDLAALVGSTRESTARALAALRRDGLVATSRGRIRLLDEDGLRRMVRST